jgi:hypothetical protein
MNNCESAKPKHWDVGPVTTAELALGPRYFGSPAQPQVDGEPGLTCCRDAFERDGTYRLAKMIRDGEAMAASRLCSVWLRLNRPNAA